MTGREIIQALHDGRHVFASAIVGMSPQWPELAKKLRHRLRVRRHRTRPARPANAVVPVPDVSRRWACRRSCASRATTRSRRARCSTPGPAAIIGPYLETADQVRGLVGAVKLRPLKGPPARGGAARPQHAGTGVGRLPGEAQRRQDSDRQHRERAGDREPARHLLRAGTRRGADRPARPVVQSGHPRAVRRTRGSTKRCARSSASPANTASARASTSGSAWIRRSRGRRPAATSSCTAPTSPRSAAR